MTFRRLALALVSASGLLSCAPATDSAAPPERISASLVEARGEVADRLLRGGGALVADYGSYQLIDVSAQGGVQADVGEVQVRDEYRFIQLNAGPIDTTSPRSAALRGIRSTAIGRQLHLVQLKGPIQPQWYQALAATGVRIVTAIPHNSYLVYGDAGAMAGVQQLAAQSFVQWDGAFLDDYKIHPAVHDAPADAFSIQLVEDPASNPTTIALAREGERQPLLEDHSLGYTNLVAFIDRASALRLATRPDVVSIHPYFIPHRRDERQDMIVSGNLNAAGTAPSGPGYLAWLAGRGFNQAQFTASGFGVDITDSGLDNAIPATPNHFGLYQLGNVLGTSRVVYARLEGTPNGGSTIQGCDGHGTINAHIVGGFVNLNGPPHTDALGFAYGLGVAPWVRLASSVIFDPNRYTFPDFEDMLSRGFRDGTRVSTNSWGARTGGAYTSDSQRYDALVRDSQPAASAVPAPGNQEMVIVFAAGNSGPGPNSVGSPGTAKNVFTSGASENNHPFGGPDQCNVADSAADSPMDVAFFSSRGPLDDQRVKPDLMAPGTHVSGGVAQEAGQRANPPANPNGQALSCFDASGVCAGAGGSNFHPNGQQWTTASSGTSHSTPAMAGGAALLRQHFINQALPPPSPAMTKAALMNSARYMNGTGANDTLPSNNQGMGLMDLGRALDSTPRRLRDQDPADLFTATGQTRTLTVFAADSTRPFRVTVAWTDAPGPTAGNAYLNNLDLTVTAGGTTYRGNVFTAGASIPGGAADLRNNVESVFLPTPPTGPITVTVTATNINSDGVPGNATPLDQDYALVIYNACNNQPPAPGGLSASVPGNNQIQLAWTSTGAPAYTIYRSFTAGGPYTQVGTSATASFLDTTVSGGTTYFYVVRALDCAESANSNEASATATGICTLPPFFAGLASASNAQTSTCGVNLAWAAGTPACGGTLTYNIYRSSSASFTPSLANRIATGQTGTSYNDVANLQSGIPYYYVVRAVEAAVQTVEEPNTVRRSTAPTGTAVPVINYFDDFDGTRPPNAAAYWIEGTLQGPEDLNLATCSHHSAITAYRFGAAICSGTYATGATNELRLGGDGSVSPSINGFVFPAGARGTMTFRHGYAMEQGFDGAVLLYNVVGAGGPYQLVTTTPSPTAPYIVTGGYNGTVNGGLPAWTGNTAPPPNGSFQEVTVNLDGLAGRTAWFGWGYVSDASVTIAGGGHFLDNVSIQASTVSACTPGSTPPGPAGSFAVTLPPTAGAGTQVTASFEARDGAGQRATGYSGTAQLTNSDPAAVMPGSVTFAGGVASVQVEFRTIGTQTVTATDSVNPAVTGAGVSNVTSGPATTLTYLSQPADALAGQPIGPVIRVEVRDGLGNLVTVPTPVTMAIDNNPSGGTLLGTTTQNTSGGVATFSNLAIDRVGNGYTLRASTPGVTPLTSSAFNISVGPAAAVEVTVQPTSAQAGAVIAPAVEARIRDGFGNLVTTWTTPVQVAIASNPGGGTLSGTTSRAPVGGMVSFNDLSIDRSGTGYTLRVSSGTLSSGTSAAFNISAAAPDRVVVIRQPSNAVAGTPFNPTVQAQVRDRFGNLVTSDASAVTATLGNANGATLLGTTTVTAAGGVATFPDLAVDRVGSGYFLNVDVPGLTGGVSTAFAITTGPASLVGFATPPADTPAGASIAPAVQVSVTDAFGNPIASAAVVLALANNPTGATLFGTLTQTTSASGIATFNDLSIRVTGAGYTLRAAASTLSGTSAGFAIIPAAPSALEVTTQPSSIIAGAAIAPAVAVRVRDAFGNTVTGYGGAVDASLSANPPGNGTLSGTTSRMPVAGVATFDDLTIDKAGNGYQLALASGSLPVANTSLFNVSAGAPSQLVVSRQPSNSVAGVAFSPTVQALVQDQFGNITSATPAVTASLGNAGSATLLGTTTVAAVNGVVTFPDLAVDLVGAGYVLHLDATGLTRGTSTAFAISPAAPSRLDYTVQPSDVVAGVAIAPGVRVAARDAFGNLATSFASQVTVSLATNPGGGVLTGTRSATAVAGVATFSNLLLDKAGSGYSLNATAAGVAAGVSAPFAVLPAAASRLAFGVQPSRSVAGASIAPAVEVQLMDRFGNVSTSTASVTLGIQTNPGAGTLSGTTSVAAANGVATFSDLSINRAAAGYQLSATSAGLTSALSSLFDIDPGPAAALGFRALPARVTAGATISAVTVEVRDALGNLVRTASPTTVTLGLGANPGNGTLMGTTTGTTVNGVVSFNTLSLQRAGTGYTLTADAPSLAQGVSGSFDVVAANPAALAFTTPPASTTAAAPFAVAVEARDSFGNQASSYSGTVTLSLGSNPAGGALAGTTTATASGGAASFSGLSIAKAGAGYTLAASASGLSGATSDAFDIAAGPAAGLEIIGLAATVTAFTETTFSVRAVDGSGNLAVDLAGAATVASSDATATLPAGASFTGGQASDLRITFKRAGSQTVTVTVGNLSVTGTVTVAGLEAPTVSITSPQEGAKVSGVVSIVASGAVAATTALTQIEIFVDGTSIGSGTVSPVTVDWDTAGLAANSSHQITAVITDGTGASTTSAPINVVVGGGCGCSSGSGGLSLIGLAALALFRRRRARLASR